MREVSFVNKLKFNFNGNVTKRALVIGDVDNDNCNELVCANLQGDLAIFKGHGPEKFAYAADLGMVTACIIGDLINVGKNHVTVINMEGWLFIFDVTAPPNAQYLSPSNMQEPRMGVRQQINNPCDAKHAALKLDVLYDQRMPANCKELLLADLDGDGENELIIGLTDRVLRTYKWIKIGSDRGKFVGLYKWEFADQIGSVSLNASRHENCQDIIVAQPGGTYAKLECYDKKPLTGSSSVPNSMSEQRHPDSNDSQQQVPVSSETTNDGDNVKTEYISKLTPEYHQLALGQMRNHHISTEVLGGIRNGSNSKSYSLIVIATLDGTLMLVNKDEILWSLQVDHQLFALAVLNSEVPSEERSDALPQSESTCTIVPNAKERTNLSQPSGSQDELSCDNGQPTRTGTCQYFVACAWNGKTYIIDEGQNYLRFKFDEAVSAFTAGNYYFGGQHHTSLVYATFNNQIVLYYDVVLDDIRPSFLLNEIMNNPDNGDLLRKLEELSKKLNTEYLPDHRMDQANSENDTERATRLRKLLHTILYNLNDEEISL